MSTKCCYRVDGKVQEETYHTGKKITHVDTRPCSKNIAVLLRVDYSGLALHRTRENRFFDVFGFCQLHGEMLVKDPALWGYDPNNRMHGSRVRNLRGDIRAVSVVDTAEDPKELAKTEDKIRLMVSVKSDIRRLMSQRNTSRLSIDDWRVIFGECIDDHVVEEVMES